MPLYVYECPKCKKTIESIGTFSEKVECNKCHIEMKKKVTTHSHFKIDM